MSARAYDLLVVGGGLIGAAIAWGARRAGADVALLDEGDVAHRASRGNFGLVWLQGKGVGAPAYMRWSQEAGRLWPGFAATLTEETGLDLGWRGAGGLHFCFAEAQVEARREVLRRARAEGGALDMEIVDRATLRHMIPGLGPQVAGASFCRQDAQVNPLLLLRALLQAFQAAGGRYLPDAAVEGLSANGVFRAATRAGELRGRRVALAAGLGAARLAPQLGLKAPVRPERGQIVVTERVAPCFPYAGDCLRQTENGSFLFGSSHEEAGFDDGADVPTAAALCGRALRVLPALAEARVARIWGALRVMTPDGLPIYEESAAHPGAFLATCHSGVTLASIHALRLAPALAGGRLPGELAPFGGGRFDVPAH